MKKYLIIITSLLALLSYSCTEESIEPITKNGSKPMQVTDVSVVNQNGGAIISYVIPDDPNLLYVKAVFASQPGEYRETRASYYQNSLTLDGFVSTDDCEVLLYSVSRNEIESDPIKVTITPLEAPVTSVLKSIKMEETFGGVRVYFENPTEASLRLSLLAENSDGVVSPYDTYYTSRESGFFTSRGMEAAPIKVGVCIRDRWNNNSDTVYTTVTPKYEKQLDKTKFKKVELAGGTYAAHVGSFENLWDNNTANIFHTKPGSGLPQWFTFDTGVKTQLSRFKLHHRKTGDATGEYNGGDPKVYEIWGSNNPDTDGGWENWELLGSFTSTKPSELPVGTITSEDTQFACIDGEDFDFPENTPAVRYLRFRIIKVWGLLDHMYIAELTFWGGEPQS
ncbi:MAG: DUF5000 domain-containing lipoprotein [Bacteroidales bacterium]|nr:DUF5000 domain-containing lipoprotein [Bacteroidales bacterium]